MQTKKRHADADDNLNACSQNIVQTRKCHANAIDNAHANGMHTKINMSPSP